MLINQKRAFCIYSHFADLMDLFCAGDTLPLSPSSVSGGDLASIHEHKDDVFGDKGIMVTIYSNMLLFIVTKCHVTIIL